MATCTACGHQLGVGRFCTNCGHPVDGPAPESAVTTAAEPANEAAGQDEWRTDTAERAALQPAAMPAPTSAPPPPPEARVPPAVVTPPPPPRYPLFADEAAVPVEPEVPTSVVAAATPMIEEPEPADEWEPDEDERRSALTWVAAVLLVAVLAVGGLLAWQYLRDDSGTASGDPQSQESPGNVDPQGVDVASGSAAEAPETAPPSNDVDGQLVSFDASNMLDGVPQTAWRAPGKATGMELTFRLPGRTTLTSVGMINGYAKKSTGPEGRTFDWYRNNRRIKSVVWDFGDGTTVTQKFNDDERAMQTIDIDPVRTRRVVVRIVGVTAPGTGRASSDFTAISEVSLVALPS